MPPEERDTYHHEDATQEHSFDELAKGVADGTVSRGRMLKVAGTALLGGVLSAAFPGVAQARRKRRRRFTCTPCGTAAGLSPTCASGECVIISGGIGCCQSSSSPPPPGPPPGPPPPPGGTCTPFSSNCCDSLATCLPGQCLCPGPEVCFVGRCCLPTGEFCIAECSQNGPCDKCCSGRCEFSGINNQCCIASGDRCAPGERGCCPSQGLCPDSGICP